MQLDDHQQSTVRRDLVLVTAVVAYWR